MSRSRKPGRFQPIALLRINIDEPITSINSVGSTDGVTSEPYAQALVIPVLHGHPLGSFAIELPAEGVTGDRLAELVWSEMRHAIVEHLEHDGSPAPVKLTSAGLPAPSETACWQGEPNRELAPLVSVIIATKDRTDVLEKCLSTLLENDYPNFEILVIDNGASSRKTADMVEDRFGDGDRVRYFAETQAGTSRARNRGVEEARGEIVAFTDDDVVVHRNWLRAIVRRFTIEPDVDCVTGLVLPAELETEPQLWFEEYGGFAKGYESHTYSERENPGHTALYPYTAGVFGSGNSAAFRRSALVSVGGFDTRLGPGTPTRAGEDLDTFLAIITGGRSLAYEPAAMVHHHHRRDLEGLERQLFSYGIGLTAVFTKWAVSHPRHLFGILRRVHLGAWMVLSSNSPKNRHKSASFPRRLTLQERGGMVLGPWLFTSSALRAFFLDKRS